MPAASPSSMALTRLAGRVCESKGISTSTCTIKIVINLFITLSKYQLCLYITTTFGPIKQWFARYKKPLD
jgi:hypothetical protein